MNCEACRYYRKTHYGNQCTKLQLEDFMTLANCSEGETILEKELDKSQWFFGLIKCLSKNEIEIIELGYHNGEARLVTNHASANLVLEGKGYKVAVADGTIYVTKKESA